MRQAELKNIYTELMRRRDLLICLAYNLEIRMEELDRECIINHLERWENPKPPDNIPDLMKTFFTCCFTYAPLRKYLSSVSDRMLSPEILPECLAKIYTESDFLQDHHWFPREIYRIADRVQQQEQFSLKLNQFKPRMIAVLRDGAKEMEQRLKHGIDWFYDELSGVNEQTGSEMWKYVYEFQRKIYNVGTSLICDFLKDIGCDRFVKVDHHFKKEFPELIGFNDCRRITPKEHFILSQAISDSLGISPFHLDHILYQWGRYKKFIP